MDIPPIRSFFKVTTGKIRRRNRETDPIILSPDDEDIQMESGSNASGDMLAQGSLDLSLQSTLDDTLPYDNGEGEEKRLADAEEMMLPDCEDEDEHDGTVSSDNLPIVYRKG